MGGGHRRRELERSLQREGQQMGGRQDRGMIAGGGGGGGDFLQ